MIERTGREHRPTLQINKTYLAGLALSVFGVGTYIFGSIHMADENDRIDTQRARITQDLTLSREEKDTAIAKIPGSDELGEDAMLTGLGTVALSLVVVGLSTSKNSAKAKK